MVKCQVKSVFEASGKATGTCPGEKRGSAYMSTPILTYDTHVCVSLQFVCFARVLNSLFNSTNTLGVPMATVEYQQRLHNLNDLEACMCVKVKSGKYSMSSFQM